MFDTPLDTNCWLSPLRHYTPRIVSLSACVYMNRIQNFHLKFTSIIGSEKTELSISTYLELFGYRDRYINSGSLCYAVM